MVSIASVAVLEPASTASENSATDSPRGEAPATRRLAMIGPCLSLLGLFSCVIAVGASCSCGESPPPCPGPPEEFDRPLPWPARHGPWPLHWLLPSPGHCPCP